MLVVIGYPPNYAAVKAAFSLRSGTGTIFAWGQTIFNPDRIIITPSLHAHEEVHSIRQLAMGVEEWWDRYMVDTRFRFDEELLAHRAEFERCKDGPPMLSATAQRKTLGQIARRLSGPLYGRLITPEKAAGLIVAQPNRLVKEVNLGDSP